MSDSGERQQNGLLSLGDVARVFFGKPSPQVMIAGLSLGVTLRLLIVDWRRWDRWDLVAVLTVVALAPLFEWFIHLFILHMKPRRVLRFLVDPGAGHREHHQEPNAIDRVLLLAPDAFIFQLANAAIVTVLLAPVLWLAGADLLPPILTGIIAAVAALMHYEWSHFLFHTAYQPKTRYYRRLKRNHRLHHWRNERYWLGITSNAGDRLFRTYPASRSAVPASTTAKTLGVAKPNPEAAPSDQSIG